MLTQIEKSATLTAREREIALLAASGFSNKAIASELNSSEGTVKVHMHNIFRKLSIKKRAALIIQFNFQSIERAAPSPAVGRRDLRLGNATR